MQPSAICYVGVGHVGEMLTTRPRYLVSLQPLLVDALKEAFDLVISEDPAVELVYDRLNRFLTAQLLVHGWGRLLLVLVLTGHADICNAQRRYELGSSNAQLIGTSLATGSSSALQPGSMHFTDSPVVCTARPFSPAPARRLVGVRELIWGRTKSCRGRTWAEMPIVPIFVCGLQLQIVEP